MIESAPYKRITQELTKGLLTIYTDLIERVVLAGTLWVQRTASGEYRFSTELGFKDCTERIKQKIPTMLTDLPQRLGIPVQGNSQLLIGMQLVPRRQRKA